MPKPMNALQVLMEDHDYVKKSHREFQKLDPEEGVDAVQALVKQVCAALKVHVALEEGIFYPAVRKALKDKDLMEEAQVEHGSAKILLLYVVLDVFAEHREGGGVFGIAGLHAPEMADESEMFPKVRRARLNLQALGKKLMAREISLAPR